MWVFLLLLPFSQICVSAGHTSRQFTRTDPAGNAQGIADTHGQRELAATAGVSLSELSAVLLGKRSSSPSTLAKLCVSGYRLGRAGREEGEQAQGVLDEARRNRELEGLRRFAKRMGIDSAILDRALKGRTKPGPLTLAKLQALLEEEF